MTDLSPPSDCEPGPAGADPTDDELSPADEALFLRRYHIGTVAEAAAGMEAMLRAIFSSLLGSPRANVVAAGQSVAWLTTNIIAMIDTNEEVRAPSLGDPQNVGRLRASIVRCQALNADRNRMVHGLWVDGRPDGRPGLSLSLSKWRKPWPIAEDADLSEIEALAGQLSAATEELVAASLDVKGIFAGT